MYSKMALSPVASEIDRWRVAGREPSGIQSDTTSRSPVEKRSTTSATVAKQSSTYWAQMDTERAFLFASGMGKTDSASQSRLAASPFSFMPSVVQIS